ncbi:PAS domain-containing protein [Maricaulis salignorans]|uniref:PAS domain-containing protein n=1 Tax=Maricaulis salignorans TaxID=144026 RepID=UPI003A922825
MVDENFLSGQERRFETDQVIVTKTDLKGRITYANEVFQTISSLTEDQCLGKPHNIIRHPEMPRCIFHLLWQTIQSGREIFAYVMNRAPNGDHYWVLAHVTPSVNEQGEITGYHSNRRVPERRILTQYIEPLYAELRAEERRHKSPAQAIAASRAMLQAHLLELGLEYDEFVWTLGKDTAHARSA